MLAALTVSAPAHALSAEQIARYRTAGWISGLSVYGGDEVAANRRGFEALVRGLPAGADAFAINAWHLTDRLVYDLCTHPRLLDCIEDLLGPDILLWGSHFFCKDPGDQRTVAWHQDARYWPLAPHRTVTAWLAIDDSDLGNGAMRVLTGTHGHGLMPHHQGVDPASLLAMSVDPAAVGGLALDDPRADVVALRAGEISLHDDNLIHGSPANPSSRRRCGLTMRFMRPEVRCDAAVWPNFSAILVRGNDRCGHTLLREPPTATSKSMPCIDTHPY